MTDADKNVNKPTDDKAAGKDGPPDADAANPTANPAADSERDNERLAERRDADPHGGADHDGIGGTGRMPDAQALTRPGPGDPVPTVESVVDPDQPAHP